MKNSCVPTQKYLGSTPTAIPDCSSCSCAPWEATVTAEVTQLPPTMWDTRMEFLAPGCCREVGSEPADGNSFCLFASQIIITITMPTVIVTAACKLLYLLRGAALDRVMTAVATNLSSHDTVAFQGQVLRAHVSFTLLFATFTLGHLTCPVSSGMALREPCWRGYVSPCSGPQDLLGPAF